MMGRLISMESVSRHWAIRVGAGSLFLVMVGYAIRSYFLPELTVVVFLQHAESVDWLPATRNPLFEGGRVEFAAHDLVQLGGEDLGEWHEVATVSFEDEVSYQVFLARIDAQQNLARYHLLRVEPMAPELHFLTNLRLRSFLDDDTVEVGARAPMESVVPDPRYAQRWTELFTGSYRDELLLLNLITFNESPDILDDKQGVDADSEEVFDRYKEKAFRVLGRMGAQISQVGSIDSVVVGPDARKYDTYGFAHYPSVLAFEVVFTAKERVDAQVHQRAALSAESSMGYWAKPYDEFRLRPK